MRNGLAKAAVAHIAWEKMRLAVLVLCYQVLDEYHVAVCRVSLVGKFLYTAFPLVGLQGN